MFINHYLLLPLISDFFSYHIWQKIVYFKFNDKHLKYICHWNDIFGREISCHFQFNTEWNTFFAHPSSLIWDLQMLFYALLFSPWFLTSLASIVLKVIFIQYSFRNFLNLWILVCCFILLNKKLNFSLSPISPIHFRWILPRIKQECNEKWIYDKIIHAWNKSLPKRNQILHGYHPCYVEWPPRFLFVIFFQP